MSSFLSNIERFGQFLSETCQLEDSDVSRISKKLAPYFEAISGSLMDDFLLFAEEVHLIPTTQQN